VTAGASEPPDALLDQLRIPDDDHRPGRLVIPIGDERGQVMTRIVRVAEETFEREEFHTFRFVPLVGEGGMD